MQDTVTIVCHAVAISTRALSKLQGLDKLVTICLEFASLMMTLIV